MTPQTRARLTKIGLGAGALALMAGAVGGGALVTANSTIADNKWTTKGLPRERVDAIGDPFDATLDAKSPEATTHWQIINRSTKKQAAISGDFGVTKPSANAADVDLTYIYTERSTTGPLRRVEVDGGTLEAPKPITRTLTPGETFSLDVKATFHPDKTIDDDARVDTGDFTVNYQFAN